MSLLSITNLTFAWPGSYDNVFTDLNLQLDTGWKLGLTGRNGRGKTTLLRLLCGEEEYAGSIRLTEQPRRFPYPAPDPEATVAQAARAAAGGDPADWELERELGLLGLGEEFLDRRFGSLSPGEQTRALLAALFLQQGCYPLIDEPTNHLDAEGRARLGRYLRGQRRGFLLVSHDRALLNDCVDHILSLERSGPMLLAGSYDDWQREADRRDARELAENDRLAGEISRLQAGVRRTAAWSDQVEKSKFNTRNSGLRVDRGYVGHQSAKMMKRAKAIEARQQKAIAEKSALLKDLETAEPLKLHPLQHPAACLVRCRDLTVQYGGRPVFAGVGFELHAGDRLALTGPNGCGKSSLLRLVCGQAVPHTGLCQTASGLVISYLPQTPEDCPGTAADYADGYALDKSLFFAILRKLGFERVQFEKPVAGLSAGQRKKLMLARSLCQPAHLYVWDEPLNYIDVLSRRQVEQLILQYRPTLLFVEHDRAFCRAVATRTLPLGGA